MLVEKCCHFFDLFLLITGMEILKVGIQSIAQRGINYSDELQQSEHPIMDAAYVIFPFVQEHGGLNKPTPDQSYKTTRRHWMPGTLYVSQSIHIGNEGTDGESTMASNS
jgi:hypothetical protein